VQTLRYAVALCVGFGLVATIAVQFVSEPVVDLFDKTAEVVLADGQYPHGYIWDCVFAGVHFSCSGYFCAYGTSNVMARHLFI